MSSEPVVSAKNIGKSYQLYSRYDDRLKQVLFGRWKTFYKEFWAVKDVSFDVGKGECVGFIGRNGAGKTTLLQIVCGITEPTVGSITVRGRVAPVLALGAGFDLDLTGRENVMMVAAILGLSRKSVLSKMDQIQDFAQIGDYFDQPSKHYSSGMIARVALAVCIHSDPDVLIVDEALSVGDGAFQEQTRSFIENFVKTRTCILVSHDIGHIEKFCHRVVWVENGVVRMVGTPKEVLGVYSEELYGTPKAGKRFEFGEAEARE